MRSPEATDLPRQESRRVGCLATHSGDAGRRAVDQEQGNTRFLATMSDGPIEPGIELRQLNQGVTEGSAPASGLVYEKAHAKLNLALDVVGSRPDGYHELRSVMQTISLHDSLCFSLRPLDQIREGATSGSFLVDPIDGDFSLIDRAIDLVRAWGHVSEPVYYRLNKRIPVAAGLGGGSSDAAAALRGTARLLELEISSTMMTDLASHLGSDVPYFLTGGTALVEGRGERVTPLDAMPKRWVVLINMGLPVSTGSVFTRWSAGSYRSGRGTERVLAGLRTGKVVVGGNDLFRPAVLAFPVIAEGERILSEVAPKECIAMTGSGGTMFALFESEAEARAAGEAIRAAAPWTHAATTCSGETG